MPTWLVVFSLVWLTGTIFGAVLLGAYVGYCKEQKLNPIKHMGSGFLGITADGRNNEEEMGGFYS